jgi:hypothetical protein
MPDPTMVVTSIRPPTLFERNLRHNRLAELYAYWDSCRDGRPLPPQDKLDAIGLAPWRENIAIVQVREQKNFTYRFYGLGFKEAFGVNMAGLDVMTLPPEQASLLRQEYRTVVQTAKPHWRSYTAWFEEQMQTWERVSLPLAGKGGTVGMILVCAYQVH